MSEKKILCMEMESPCVKCGSKLCSICVAIKRYKSWPTREQAIENIGRALCKKGICARSSDCPKSCDIWKTEVGDCAKAALNALLEGKK